MISHNCCLVYKPSGPEHSQLRASLHKCSTVHTVVHSVLFPLPRWWLFCRANCPLLLHFIRQVSQTYKVQNVDRPVRVGRRGQGASQDGAERKSRCEGQTTGSYSAMDRLTRLYRVQDRYVSSKYPMTISYSVISNYCRTYASMKSVYGHD